MKAVAASLQEQSAHGLVCVCVCVRGDYLNSLEPERETHLFLTKGLGRARVCSRPGLLWLGGNALPGMLQKVFPLFHRGQLELWPPAPCRGHTQQAGEQECSQKDGHYHREQCPVLLGRMEQDWVGGTELGEGLLQAPHLTVLTLRRIHRLLKPAKGQLPAW